MDWQKNRLAIGAAVLVALIGIIAYKAYTRSHESDATGADATLEIPDIDGDSIDSIEITRPGEPAITLSKVDGTWRVTAPVDALADESAVRTAIEKLDELEIDRVAAQETSSYERLEVDDAHGVHVVAKSGSETLIDMLVGAFGGGTTMARLEGQSKVLALRGSIKFAFNKELDEWRDRGVVDVASSNVKDVTLVNEHGTFHFVKNGEGAWELPEGAAAIERFGAARVSSFVSSLTRLRATSFAASDVTPAQSGLETPRATLTLVVEETPDAEEGADAGPATRETIVLTLGGAKEEGGSEHYLARAGAESVFVVSQFIADKLLSDVDAFQTPEPGSEPDENAMPEMPPGMPGGMPGGGPPGAPGGGQIPPELMRQIQEQLQKQGASAGGH